MRAKAACPARSFLFNGMTVNRRFWVVLGVGVSLFAAVGSFVAWRWLVAHTAGQARSELAAGRYSDAARDVDRWIRIAPRAAEAYYLKARLALALERPAHEIESSFDRARRLGAPDADLALVRALTNVKLGRHAEAEAPLRQAFDEGTPDPQVDEALARVYIETFNVRRAEEVLERWAREAPSDPRPYLWRVEVDRRKEGTDEVLAADYREALRRDPNLAPARLGLAKSLRQLHRNAEAQIEFERYLTLRPDDPAGHLGAGQNARELGDDTTAAREFERTIALDPKNATVHKELATLATTRGDDQEALAHLDQAMAIDPFDVTSRYSRSLLLARLGRAEEAERERAAVKRLREELAHLNELKARLLQTPNQPELEVQIAEWMIDHGHDDEGARWAEKVLRNHPRHPRANRLLADYHNRHGRPGRANFYRMQASGEP